MRVNNRFLLSRRLKHSEDFKKNFQQGKRLKQGCLIAYVGPNGLGYARLGLAITKRAVPKAVSRNKVKRCIREAFRTNQKFFASLDLIIMVTYQCVDKQILYCDLEKLWSRLRVYHKHV